MTSAMRRTRLIAWALGLSGAVACLLAGGVALALGAPDSFLLVYLVGVLMGLLGALIASRQPRNSIGWLMGFTSLAASLVHLPAGYGYAALVDEQGAWPFGSAAVWLGAWGWIPVLGMLPLIAVRFPDGSVPPRWRAAEWLAVAGTALFALGIALEPADILVGFLPIPGAEVTLLSPHVQSPVGISVPVALLSLVQGTGLTLTLLGYVAAAAALTGRFRRARGDERLQLKWFAYSGALIASAFVYGAVAWNLFGQPLYLALTPLEFAGLTLPVAIGIAILRYRLYDIDLLINRTLVYAGLTAILGAMYAAVITFLQRLFVSASGQKSDVAYVLAAFVVVVTFSPIKDWLQRQVDRRLAHKSPSAILDQFRSEVQTVVSVMDVQRVAFRLLDRAAVAFDARGAALYLQASDTTGPVYSRGHLEGDPVIQVYLRHEEQQFGRLVMGPRRGDATYTERDRDELQRSADAVGEALALAERLRHRPIPEFH
jgi:two-component system NarL family sensor kinase